MNVCIIRNAEVDSNAGMMRVIDALQDKYNLLIMSRTRTPYCLRTKNKFYKKKVFKINSKRFDNFEISIKSEMGRGLKNIFQLILYQICLFVLLVRNKNQFEVIHSFDLDTGLVSILFAKIFNKKIVYHIADFYVDSRPGLPISLMKIVKKLEYTVISDAAAVIICTEKRTKQISGSNPKKLYVVHNVPISSLNLNNTSIVLPKDIMDKKKLNIGYVGGLSKIHFTKEILKVVRENNDVFLNIAGYGELSSYVEKVGNRSNNIQYYGKVDYNSALYLYNNSDLMLMLYDPAIPNHKYSAPNKIYEAMMLGKAIIVFKNTGIDDLVQKERMGLVIEYSETSLSEAIRFIIDNPNELDRMKVNAKNAYKNYTWEEMKKRIQLIYSEL